MSEPLTVMDIAFRVLWDITENRQPDPADVVELRSLVPDCLSAQVDQLACEVISRATSAVVRDEAGRK